MNGKSVNMYICKYDEKKNEKKGAYIINIYIYILKKKKKVNNYVSMHQ